MLIVRWDSECEQHRPLFALRKPNEEHAVTVISSQNIPHPPLLSCPPPKGAEPDRGSQAAGPAGRRQDSQSVVHQGEEDEGHLPHPQPVQHRRHPEVSDRRGVVPRLRHGLHPVCSAEGNGEKPSGATGKKCIAADVTAVLVVK